MAYSQVSTPRNNTNNGGSAWGNSNNDLRRGSKSSGKWFYGGNFGGSIDRNIYLDISPLIGYRISEDFSVGTGLVFNYVNTSVTSFTLYGVRALTRYQIFNDLFLQAELETLRLNSAGRSEWQTRLPVGGGYRQRLGGNSFFTFEVLYDLLYDSDETIYPSPLILRGGVTVGI